MDLRPLEKGTPIYSFGFLFAGFGMLALFVELYFKNDAQEIYRLPAVYASYMTNHADIVSKGTLFVSVLAVIFGPLLLKFKGWRFTAMLSPLLSARVYCSFSPFHFLIFLSFHLVQYAKF